MAITKEQWEEITGTLSMPWGSVDLKIDNFIVNLRVEYVKEMTFGIKVYIDKKIEHRWIFDGTDEAKRFFCPISKFIFSAKERALYTKLNGGKRCPKAELERINRKYVYYRPFWSNFKTMRRHFEKNNHSMEVVNIGYVPC